MKENDILTGGEMRMFLNSTAAFMGVVMRMTKPDEIEGISGKDNDSMMDLIRKCGMPVPDEFLCEDGDLIMKLDMAKFMLELSKRSHELLEEYVQEKS